MVVLAAVASSDLDDRKAKLNSDQVQKRVVRDEMASP
jgi:hypothetical protein